MSNKEKDIFIQQKENLDFHSLKTDLYSIYCLSSQNLLHEENIIDINQIKIDEIIFNIKLILSHIKHNYIII